MVNFDDNDHYDFERTNRIFNTIGIIGVAILAITVITLIILIS